MYDRRSFKLEAKELMRASRPHYMLVALVYVLLTTGLNYAVTAVTGSGGILAGTLSVFLNILVFLFSMVMGVGLAHYTLRLSRREQSALGDLFESFAFAGRSIGMNLLISLYTFLWALLIVGGFAVIIAAAVFLMEDAMAVSVILIALGYIGMAAALVAVVLRYAMSAFALAENPDAGASAAIRRSVQVMRGNRWKLFVMELSFLGWSILAALIVGVVTGVGFLVSGTSWMVESAVLSGGDWMELTSLFSGLANQFSLWSMLGEIVGLPLTLWLTVYMQTSFARFYNFVSGYGAQETGGGYSQPYTAPAVPLGQAQPEPYVAPEPPTPPQELETPRSEEAPATIEAPQTEAAPPVEEVPRAEEAPAEEAPPVEETTSVEEAPVTEEAPQEEMPPVEEPPQEEKPRSEEPARSTPPTPPGGYYTPAPRLDDGEDA